MNLGSLLIDISQKIGKKLKFTDQTLHGALNNNWVVKDKEEKKYVLRIPKENPPQIPLIRDEYEIIGYAKNGSKYRFRTSEEQFSFTEKCFLSGIPVPRTSYSDNKAILREFIEGTTLDNFLKKTNNTSVIEDYLKTIVKAHEKGIILGDRWGPNTIVAPEKNLVEIDFDIDLTAEDAREFEIAQILSYCLLWSRNKTGAIKSIIDLVNSDKFDGFYDGCRISEFLHGHEEYFRKKEFGSIKREVENIIFCLK